MNSICCVSENLYHLGNIVIPNEIVQIVFSDLKPWDLVQTSLVCQQWKTCSEDIKLWSMLAKKLHQILLRIENKDEIYQELVQYCERDLENDIKAKSDQIRKRVLACCFKKIANGSLADSQFLVSYVFEDSLFRAQRLHFQHQKKGEMIFSPEYLLSLESSNVNELLDFYIELGEESVFRITDCLEKNEIGYLLNGMLKNKRYTILANHLQECSLSFDALSNLYDNLLPKIGELSCYQRGVVSFSLCHHLKKCNNLSLQERNSLIKQIRIDSPEVVDLIFPEFSENRTGFFSDDVEECPALVDQKNFNRYQNLKKWEGRVDACLSTVGTSILEATLGSSFTPALRPSLLTSFLGSALFEPAIRSSLPLTLRTSLVARAFRPSVLTSALESSATAIVQLGNPSKDIFKAVVTAALVGGVYFTVKKLADIPWLHDRTDLGDTVLKCTKGAHSCEVWQANLQANFFWELFLSVSCSLAGFKRSNLVESSFDQLDAYQVFYSTSKFLHDYSSRKSQSGQLDLESKVSLAKALIFLQEWFQLTMVEIFKKSSQPLEGTQYHRESIAVKRKEHEVQIQVIKKRGFEEHIIASLSPLMHPGIPGIADLSIGCKNVLEWMDKLKENNLLESLLFSAYPKLPSNYCCPYSGELLFYAISTSDGISYGRKFFEQLKIETELSITDDMETSWRLYYAFIDVFKRCLKEIPSDSDTTNINHAIALLNRGLTNDLRSIFYDVRRFISKRHTLLFSLEYYTEEYPENKTAYENILAYGWSLQKCDVETENLQKRMDRLLEFHNKLQK